MTKNVFAGMWEIAAENGMNKSIARFPDVCMSPPSPPAGPIPIPYPDTSFSNNLKSASTTVLIGGKGAALAQKSYYKEPVLGDEAATRTFGANVVTHQITGKTYFQAWCMDVKFEGKNVCRHFDITTSNHASGGTTTVPAPPLETLNEAAADDKSDPTKWCQCCKKHPPHSKAQEEGRSVSEKEWYNPTQTGPRERTGPGNVPIMAPRNLTDGEKTIVRRVNVDVEAMRAWCPGNMPDDPPKTECDKYYVLEPGEKEKIDRQYEDLRGSAEQPASWGAPNVAMVAHKVPRAAGGCPVGPNAVGVTDQTCADLDHQFGTSQGQIYALRMPK